MSLRQVARLTSIKGVKAAHIVPARKWSQLALLSGAILLAMTLWFSASAVLPQLTREWNLTGGQQAWMTMSVQLGFVFGALISAVLNLADRYSSRGLITACALLGAGCTASMALLDIGVATALVFRFLTGFFLAGVYPPGMKLVATWCRTDRGFGIGILIGALTIGSAFPHLVNGLNIFPGGFPHWRTVLLITSGQAAVCAAVIGLFFREGPFRVEVAPFRWKFAADALRHRPTRLANLGYLGHMWELFAMWTWVPVFIIVVYDRSGWSDQAARIVGFSIIAVGAAGCILAGKLADRLGRTRITIWSLGISGSCAMLAGMFFDHPALLTAVCLLWGFAVVADSAQFSAAVSELTDPRYIGTALTIQTSLGFLLTLLTIRIVPSLLAWTDWRYVFPVLALGPAAGIWSMRSLRQYPEAVKMASGNR